VASSQRVSSASELIIQLIAGFAKVNGLCLTRNN
jgi:hypothetical protein